MAVFRTFLVQKCKIMLTLSFLERTLARVSFLKKEGNCKSPLLNYHNRKNILYQAVFSSSSTITDSASISATSIVPISSSTSFAFVPSLNIVKQYGQALEIIDGITAIACSVRSTLMRVPVVSSVHIKPPPAHNTYRFLSCGPFRQAQYQESLVIFLAVDHTRHYIVLNSKNHDRLTFH